MKTEEVYVQAYLGHIPEPSCSQHEFADSPHWQSSCHGKARLDEDDEDRGSSSSRTSPGASSGKAKAKKKKTPTP